MSAFDLACEPGETWLGCVLRHTSKQRLNVAFVTAAFAVNLRAVRGDEKKAAINTLLEFDILPLAQEGVS
jgi:hypothetical protein